MISTRLLDFTLAICGFFLLPSCPQIHAQVRRITEASYTGAISYPEHEDQDRRRQASQIRPASLVHKTAFARGGVDKICYPIVNSQTFADRGSARKVSIPWNTRELALPADQRTGRVGGALASG